MAEKAKEEENAAIANAKSNPTDKSKAKKGKLVAKSGGHTYQFQILETVGIPRAEIKKFADPLHWLTHFPPIAIVSIHCSSIPDPLCLPPQLHLIYRQTIMPLVLV